MGVLFRDTREDIKAVGRAVTGECGHSFKYFRKFFIDSFVSNVMLIGGSISVEIQ